MKSTNIVFTNKNQVDVISEEIPSINENQILCKSEISLISIGTELRCLKGEMDPGTNWSEWVKYPFKPGYCMTGTVIKVGTNVIDFNIGDKVVTQQPHCQYFIDYPLDPNLIKIPEGITFEEASWQPIGCITQLGVRRAEIKLGDTIGVVGLGMLGQLVIQYIRMSGARKTITMDLNDKRLELAKKHGANYIFKGDVKDARETIGRITRGKMMDTVFEITGLPQVLSSTTKLLRRLGKVVLLGDNTMPSKQFLGPNVVSDSISILGIHGSMSPSTPNEFNPWTWKEMAMLFFDFVLDGRMIVKPMITDVFSPLEAEKVYAWLTNNKLDTVGVIFDWSMLG